MRRGGVLAAIMAASLTIGVSATAGSAAAAAPAARPNSAQVSAQVRSAWARVSSAAVQSHALRAAALPAGSPVPAMSVHDPKGDAFDSLGDPSVPAGDLTGAGVLQNAQGTAVGVTVNAPTNPASDPTWLSGDAAVVWLIDTNRDGLPDNAAVMTSDLNGTVIAQVGTLAAPTCDAVITFTAKVGYRVTARPGCLPHLGTVEFAACLFYGGLPNDLQTSVDCAPDSGFSNPVNVQQPPPVVHSNGYWMLGADGHVYAFGGAKGFSGFVANAVAMAPRRDGTGYWVVDRAGHVFTYGTALFYGGAPALGAGEIVSTISTTQNDGGYWLFTNKGRAFPFGNAGRFGDMSGVPLNGPIVASVATPTGRGYYMVGSDGGIFSFGDARFHGSTGNIHLNKPVVGISPTPDSRGYWLVASDGGVFAFAAPFRGSMGATTLNRPVDGLVAFGNGYLMAASDGGIFDFSNRPFEGSLADNPPTAPIIGVAAYSI
jgi:hypothetical protein